MLLILSACLYIPEIIKITSFSILSFQLWNSNLLFSFWKKRLTFFFFLTFLHLKQLFSTSIFFSLCFTQKFSCSSCSQCPWLCKFNFAGWGCAIFTSWWQTSTFFHEDTIFSKYFFSTYFCAYHIHLQINFFKPIFLLDKITEHRVLFVLFSWLHSPFQNLLFSQGYFYKLLP